MLWFTSQVQPTTCFSKENVMGTKSHSFIYVLSMATCVLKLQSSVVKNETIWPAKSTIFATWHYKESFPASIIDKWLCDKL